MKLQVIECEYNFARIFKVHDYMLIIPPAPFRPLSAAAPARYLTHCVAQSSVYLHPFVRLIAWVPAHRSSLGGKPPPPPASLSHSHTSCAPPRPGRSAPDKVNGFICKSWRVLSYSVREGGVKCASDSFICRHSAYSTVIWHAKVSSLATFILNQIIFNIQQYMTNSDDLQIFY